MTERPRPMSKKQVIRGSNTRPVLQRGSRSERRIAELEGMLREAQADVRRLEHLVGEATRTGDELEFEPIVTLAGVPLMNLRWEDLAIQLPIDVTRRLALELLEACTWAEADAKLYAFARTQWDEDVMVGSFMAMVRESRSPVIGSSDADTAAPEDGDEEVAT